MLQKQNLKSFSEKLQNWNGNHPYDLAWRLKNNIQFGSIEHKSMDFVSMLFNLIQEEEIEDFYRRTAKAVETEEDELFESPDVLKMSQEEVREEFDKLDIDDF